MVWVYWTYAPIVLAQEEEGEEEQGAKITFFEDRTSLLFRIIQSEFKATTISLLTQALKNFGYTQEGLKFKNNGTVIMR